MRIFPTTAMPIERLLLELKSRQADLDVRRALVAKLDKRRAFMAAAIRNRTGAHGRGEPPRDPARFLDLAPANDELDRRASVSLEALQSKSDKFSRTASPRHLSA